MIEPRHPDIIIREINDLNRVIEHGQEMIRSFPNVKLLPIALQQDEYRKKQLAKNFI